MTDPKCQWTFGDEAEYRPLREWVYRWQPKIIVEVGSWKGASAITLASAQRAAGIDGRIYAVDHWCGSLEHHLSPIYGPELPYIYDHFMANVKDAGLQDRIVPIRATSQVGMQLLDRLGIRADLVYIDGDHDFRAVWDDISYARDIVKPGGVIAGDDIDWSGVQSAVNDHFIGNHEVEGRAKWYVRV